MAGRPLLYSLVDSPTHPDLSALYRRLGLREQRFASMRKAMAALKRTPPDWVVGEFLYGYGNNYAGVNLSNLDVFLHALRRYAPEARVLVFYQPSERAYLERLAELFPIHARIAHPVREAAVARVLGATA